jgi:hypothetical protein
MKIKVNLKKNKYVWKRVDNVFSHDDDDEVQVSEKKIDGNQNVVKGNLDAALYCQICKVQCLNQVTILLLIKMLDILKSNFRIV